MTKRKVLINKISKIGILSALAYILYLIKFPLPAIFPEFLEVNFSMLPIIIAAFMLGPWEAVIILIVRCLLKLPLSSTSCIGELADLIIGVVTVIPSGYIYRRLHSRKGGVISLVVAFVSWIVAALLSNWLISIPLYIKVLFGGNVSIIVKACENVIPSINASNYMGKYLLFAALPFNGMIAFAVCGVTFFVYKSVSKIFKEDFFKTREKSTRKDAKKILVISDSFKGTLTSVEVGRLLRNELNDEGHLAQYLPVSDGGEGFIEVIHRNYHLNYDEITVHDAVFNKHLARVIYNPAANAGYVELAECCGIFNLDEKDLNPYDTSTYGFGEAIKYIMEKYHPSILYVGIGGSASCDGGTGMLEALGAKFYDKKGIELTHMNNRQLGKISKIHIGAVRTLFENTEVVTLTDVVNPLLGENGAVYVYAKQKGAKDEDLPILEANLKHYEDVVYDQVFGANTQIPGEGAAGGVGFAMNRIIRSKLINGSETILNILNFEQLCNEYDIIITGEGCFDDQSFNGKIIQGIMKHQPKKLIILCGVNESTKDLSLLSTNTEIHSIVPNIATLEESLANPQENLKKLIKDLHI